MNKLRSLIALAPKRLSAAVAIVAAAIIVPAAVMAWGPERETYTYESPADKVTFNSMTNNPQIGDERNFVRIREDKTGQNFSDNVNLKPGKVYEMMVYYHNNAAENLNLTAKDVKLRMEVPGVVKPGVNAVLAGNISSSNATPGTVWDEAYGKNNTNADIALRYLSGSAKVTSNGAVDGETLPDELFTTGTKLGYNALDGNLPGCNEFAGYVTFKFRVDQPNFTVEKQVSTDGKTWEKSVTAEPGSEINYRIVYQNTGTTQQDNVSVRDMLPENTSYVAGSSHIANSVTGGSYESTVDGVTTVGYNAGSYQPQGNFFFKLKAKLPESDKLECGVNEIVNTARVTTSGGYKEDTATVTIEKECEPEQISVCELSSNKVITINETAFDSKKHSKDLSDCKVTKIQVCDLSTKEIVSINESDFDSDKYSKDLSKCETPKELPKTGPADAILGLFGLGAIVASAAYFIESRRAVRGQ